MSLIHRLNSQQADFTARLQHLLQVDTSVDGTIEATTKEIISTIKNEGDAALLSYTRRFDGVTATDCSALRIPLEACYAALQELPHDVRNALETAASRIQRYHEKQRSTDWSYTEEDGTALGQKISPLHRVGLYVPGGKAAYPSSVLMNAIPAKVAGVKHLTMVSPTPDGTHNPLVLAAAALAEVDEIWAIGGAQAVAALAYGTESIIPVDKIVGPGNAYVAAAKRQVFGKVGIDMIAGPSEILIIGDGSTPAKWVAMDLFSQAEHDELAQAILLSPQADYLDAVENEIKRLLPTQSRAGVIRSSLKNRGALIQVTDLAEACDIANVIAPEHLELSTHDAEALLPNIHHAGAIFLGAYSSEALGDYCAGPNHVLPTSGTARFSSPLGVYDFQKRSSIIKVSQQGAQTLGKVAATLADGEGLQAHAASARYRLNSTSDN